MKSKQIKSFKRKIKECIWKFKLTFHNNIYISFGENCLTDSILNRHHLKSFTTPFSHGRSNIEYILQLEKDHYKDFLNPSFLKYAYFEDTKVPRLQKYTQLRNSYAQSHMNGFEFTHHDVIGDINMRLKFEKRVHQLKKFIGRKKYVIMYHHRACDSTNIEKLISDLNQLKEYYSTQSVSSEVVLFTQKIVDSESERNLEYSCMNQIHFFTFCTLHFWQGENQEIFWARCDDDLIKLMIRKIKQIVK